MSSCATSSLLDQGLPFTTSNFWIVQTQQNVVLNGSDVVSNGCRCLQQSATRWTFWLSVMPHAKLPNEAPSSSIWFISHISGCRSNQEKGENSLHLRVTACTLNVHSHGCNSQQPDTCASAWSFGSLSNFSQSIFDINRIDMHLSYKDNPITHA